MSTVLWVVIAVVLTAGALWAYFTAQRLNSLHIRTDAALAQLKAMLDRRAAVVAVVVPELAALAQQVEMTPLGPGNLAERAAMERQLNNQLNASASADGGNGDGAGAAQPVPQLVDAETRVALAQRFYNEAVSDTRTLRLRPVVKGLRLGGTAPLPEFFDYTLGLAE